MKMKYNRKRKEVLIVWYQETVFYQICPLGLCGAPEVNDDIQAHRILKIKDFVPYLQELGIGAVYFNPVLTVILMAMIRVIIISLIRV